MMKTKLRFQGNNGFTLIEVMVALVIVSLSLSAVLASISKTIKDAATLQQRSYASWIAQNKITELRLSSESPEVSKKESEVRFASQEWSLETTISATGVERLFRIDVAVSHSGSENVIRTVTGFVGEPGIPGQANTAWTSNSQAAGDEK